MASMLHDEGEEFMLQAAFSEEASVPANFYIMLYNDTPAETDGMADLLLECAEAGYARQPVASDNTDCVIAPDAGDSRCTFKQVTFTATGDWNMVNHAAIVTVITGTGGLLIASWALSADRTLLNGDSLKFTGRIKQQ